MEVSEILASIRERFTDRLQLRYNTEFCKTFKEQHITCFDCPDKKICTKYADVILNSIRMTKTDSELVITKYIDDSISELCAS